MTDPEDDARRSHWDRAFARSSPESLSWFQAEPGVSLRLIAATGFGPDACILDVGGGTSFLVDRLLADGHTCLGVLDVSIQALDRTRARLGAGSQRVRWMHADITRFAPSRRWDVWHDRAVFHFLTEPADRIAYRDVLLRTLSADGQAIIATFGPGGPDRCSGLPALRYSAESLGRELGKELTLLETVEEAHKTPGGAVQDFLYCRFGRRSA